MQRKQINKTQQIKQNVQENGHKNATTTTIDFIAHRKKHGWYFRRTVHHITKCGQMICTQLYVRRCVATGWISSDQDSIALYSIFHFQGIFSVFVVVVIVDDVFVLSIGVGLYFATKTCIRILNCDVDELRLNVFNRSNCFFYYVFARDFYIAKNLCPLASRNYGFWCIFLVDISSAFIPIARVFVCARCTRACFK